MLKSRFRFYLSLIARPDIILGIWLIVSPASILHSFLFQEATRNAADFAGGTLAAIMLGLTLCYTGITIINSGRNPSDSRDMIFWQSLMFFVRAVFLAAGPFFFGLRYWSFAPAAAWLLASIFLMAYASRNLLIRE